MRMLDTDIIKKVIDFDRLSIEEAYKLQLLKFKKSNIAPCYLDDNQLIRVWEDSKEITINKMVEEKMHYTKIINVSEEFIKNLLK